MPESFKLAFDSRSFFLRSVKQLLIIVAAGLFIKFFIIDILRVNGAQMAPSILDGDRVLVFRTPYLPLVRSLFKPALNKPVIFSLPYQSRKSGCLRIAGHSGDTVTVDAGMFVNSNHPSVPFPGKKDSTEPVPPNYSPRDYYQPLRIPARGDTLFLDNLSIRDFFTVVSIVRQENDPALVDLKTSLIIDDSLSNDYFISDFSLYKGTVDSVPDNLKFDWFFWSRLEEFLRNTLEDRSFSLQFSLILDGKTTDIYKVKSSYVFLLADNWNSGLDSRYFGPVRENSISGRVFMVLWSYGKDMAERASFRTRRFGRIIL
jgi:signal peptidase I